MTAGQEHLEFSPQPTPGLLRGVVLALAAHALLFAVLSLALHWQAGAPPTLTVQAELWPASAIAGSPTALQQTDMAAGPGSPPMTNPSKAGPPSPTQDAGIGIVQEDFQKLQERRLKKQEQEKEQRHREALRKLQEDMDKRDMNEGDERPRDPT